MIVAVSMIVTVGSNYLNRVNDLSGINDLNDMNDLIL